MLAIFLLHCWQCIVCVQALAELLVEEHNRGLNAAMTHFTDQNPDASVILFELHNLEQAIHQNASSYNITNLLEPCYAWQDSEKPLILNGAIPNVCSNPSNYAFWDALHPTGVIHQLWGEALAKQLQQFSVLHGVRMKGIKSHMYPEWHLEQPNHLKLYGKFL
jgi:phospholipase/lecithinase/hemolysin